MSKQTIEAIHDAIQAHATDVGEEGVVTDFVASYSLSRVQEGFVDGEEFSVVYQHSYTTSEGNPYTAYGLAQAAAERIGYEVTAIDDDDD